MGDKKDKIKIKGKVEKVDIVKNDDKSKKVEKVDIKENWNKYKSDLKESFKKYMWDIKLGYKPLKPPKPEDLKTSVQKFIRCRESRSLESEIENIMFECGLYNNSGEYAYHIKTIRYEDNNNHYTTIWRLSRGLSYKDYIDKKVYFANALTAYVNIETRKGNLVIDVFKGIIPERVKYKFNTIEYLDKFALPIPLGVTQMGLQVIDITKIIHFLICGSTGGGKTVLAKSWCDALLQNPNVILFVIDFALIDFVHVKNCAVFASELDRALDIVIYLKNEMTKRKYYLANYGLDVVTYNEKYPNNKLPYMVLFIDEFAFTAPGKFHTKHEKRIRNLLQGTIAELSQQARKVGIYLIICMQRPDKDLISPIIKNNLVGRICFKTGDRGHSQTVLNCNDAFYLPDIDGRLLALWKNRLIEAQSLFLHPDIARERVKMFDKSIDKVKGDEFNADPFIQFQINDNETKRLLPR